MSCDAHLRARKHVEHSAQHKHRSRARFIITRSLYERGSATEEIQGPRGVTRATNLFHLFLLLVGTIEAVDSDHRDLDALPQSLAYLSSDIATTNGAVKQRQGMISRRKAGLSVRGVVHAGDVCCVCCVCCHPIYSGRQDCGRTSRGHTGER